MKAGFAEDGFTVYDAEDSLKAWARAALPLAEKAVKDPDLRRDWLRCEGTWFVGVDALPTGLAGEADGVPLTARVIDDLSARYDFCRPMHKAQLSVVYPGYPKPREGESEAAFRYRLIRDAAHVDGLHALGADRRRHLEECHAFLLGIPLNDCTTETSPLVVWRGSHHIIQRALSDVLSPHPVDDWHKVDVTEAYHSARREVFETCERVELPVCVGQATVMHRHMLHGIAPWRSGGQPSGRMIAYFRPELPSAESWLATDPN